MTKCLIMSFNQMSCIQMFCEEIRDKICYDQTSREETPCGQISLNEMCCDEHIVTKYNMTISVV